MFNNYVSYPTYPTYPKNNYTPTYESRSIPKESVNTLNRRRLEEKQNKIKNEPLALSFDSTYHFPELCKLKQTSLTKTKPKEDIIISSMSTVVTLPVITSIKNKKIVTKLCFKDGQTCEKDIFEDGTDINDTSSNIVIRHYNSWASALKCGLPDITVPLNKTGELDDSNKYDYTRYEQYDDHEEYEDYGEYNDYREYDKYYDI
jgi:hypothetical protein